MCEVLDKVEKKGIAKGIEKGELKKARETAFNLKEMGLSEEMIARAVNVSHDLIRQWLGVVSAN